MKYEPEIDKDMRLFKPSQWKRDVFIDEHFGINEFADKDEDEDDGDF